MPPPKASEALMAGELVLMSTREIDRLGVIRQVIEGHLKQVKAAEVLGLGVRQVARLCIAYEKDGAQGLVSRKRGRVSNRRLDEALKARVVELVRADRSPPARPSREYRTQRRPGQPCHQRVTRGRVVSSSMSWATRL
jgi:transposase